MSERLESSCLQLMRANDEGFSPRPCVSGVDLLKALVDFSPSRGQLVGRIEPGRATALGRRRACHNFTEPSLWQEARGRKHLDP